MEQGGAHTGFSIELWEQLEIELGLNTTFVRVDNFAAMLDAVKNGDADGAIANISITAAREADIDFTPPIFEGGLQIMIPYQDYSTSVLSELFILDIFYALLIATVMLFGGGM
jgi:polar amino acid transport system substrate-binding protein